MTTAMVKIYTHDFLCLVIHRRRNVNGVLVEVGRQDHWTNNQLKIRKDGKGLECPLHPGIRPKLQRRY